MCIFCMVWAIRESQIIPREMCMVQGIKKKKIKHIERKEEETHKIRAIDVFGFFQAKIKWNI